MDWQTFYERFFDWASSTQVHRVHQLTSFGPSDQVAEVAQELMDEKKRIPVHPEGAGGRRVLYGREYRGSVLQL